MEERLVGSSSDFIDDVGFEVDLLYGIQIESDRERSASPFDATPFRQKKATLVCERERERKRRLT